MIWPGRSIGLAIRGKLDSTWGCGNTQQIHVSDKAQERLRRLLAINAAGLAAAEEQAELDEIQQIEHIVILLKAQTQEQLLNNN
jgi:hypothetical protein